MTAERIENIIFGFMAFLALSMCLAVIGCMSYIIETKEELADARKTLFENERIISALLIEYEKDNR